MKQKSFSKQIRDYVIAFSLPLIILVIVLFLMGVFQENSFLYSDAKLQYISFFSYFQDVLKGNASAFYSFHIGMGTSMWGAIAYYLTSPLNLLLLLFSKEYLDIAFLLLVMLKISLSGLTMFCYLKHHFPKAKPSYLFLFSTCYALMGYVQEYCFHVMWLDVVYLAPLVLLGLDRLMEKEKPLLYAITLLLALFSNYYIGFMLCIFVGIYFLYRLFHLYRFKVDKKKMLRTFLSFMFISLCVGGMIMFLVIPSLQELALTTKQQVAPFQEGLSINWNPLDVFSMNMIGSQNEMTFLNYYYFYIYGGVIILPLICFYFFNHRITKREKLLSAIVILIFLVSFSVNYLNYIWHGFNIPFCYQGRYSFLLVFFLLMLSCRSFLEMSAITKRQYWLSGVILLVLLGVVAIIDYHHLAPWMISTTGLFILGYLVLLYWFHQYPKRKYLLVILLMVVMGELGLQFYYTLRTLTLPSRQYYDSYMTTFAEALKEIKAKDSDLFYRVVLDSYYSNNDGLLLNYPSFDAFISTLPRKAVSFFRNNAFTIGHNSILYVSGQTPFFQSILGVRYYFSSKKELENYTYLEQYEFQNSKGYQKRVYLYQNPLSLPLGFLISDKSLHFQDSFVTREDINKLSFQDEMFRTMTGEDISFFSSIPMEVKDQTHYEFTIPSDDPIYLFIHTNANEKQDQILFYVNEDLMETFKADQFHRILLPNHYQKGERVKIRLEIKGNAQLLGIPVGYSFDHDIYQKGMEKLATHPLLLTKYKGHRLEGTVDVPEGDQRILFLSMLNTPGWTVKVDGQIVEPLELYDALMGVPLTPGSHVVELSFIPPGLKTGLWISFISFIFFGGYCLLQEKILRMVRRKKE